MKKIFNLLTDSRCVLCQKPLSFETNCNRSLCKTCFKIFITEKSEFFCLKCGTPLISEGLCSKCCVDSKITHYDSFRYIQSYSGAAMQLVKLHKQHNNHKILDLYVSFLSSILTPNYPVYIVPDSFLGKIKKGKCCFSAEITRKLRKKGFYVISGIIKKSPWAKVQKLLNHNERQYNAEKSFTLNKKCHLQIDSDSIQLVDDIFTTGATINRCSKLLKDVGFKKVFAYSLFKAKFS